ncbi:sensor histidine kinase [Pelagibacterium xiamenense]|uniref:sensor histidine kinase n=1 Tax=Pelagibacterium xiamenense TaxID=2901140 RepID=UPI001E44A9CC|nr:HAMP domain-containing sensor histidine kinase [Pelagibacterium xiamenense]MCD7058908.1 HAMP domain-containing histidine kinase [Pelagibacterium xiamenense]
MTDRVHAGPFSGLSFKLIAAIAGVILLVEIAVFFPSLANFRAGWLDDRLRVGGVAVRVFDAVPDVTDLPVEITEPLLQSAGALAIVYRREGQSDLISLDAAMMPEETHTADMRDRNPLRLIADAVDTMVSGGRTLRIVGVPPGAGDAVVEVIMPESPLRADMLFYAGNIAMLSLIIAGVTAFALYVFAERLLIGPLRRLTGAVLAFGQNPENGRLIIRPNKNRKDEIGVLEREFSQTQEELFTMLRQRRHLADLGLAVSKINHDLRNMLTSAQLLSDQVATLDDPKVQRLAPRLVNTIDKATEFAQSVLDYGRQQSRPPRPAPVDLRALGTEASVAAGLAGHPHIVFDNRVPDDLVVTVDPDHLARVFINIFKNAREALETAADTMTSPTVTFSAEPRETTLRLTLADNGPGLPPRARENLFVAFKGSARSGGTGLGLAIARELVEANGGTIALAETEKGTAFTIDLPLR